MTEVATNRDLYRFVADLAKRQAECPLTLRAYLENLRRLGHQQRDREAIALKDFATLLQAAFELVPGTPAAEPIVATADGYPAWERRITGQIRDLDEMREAGILDDKQRYFGVDAPRGGRWECGAVGSLGGWQEGDDTGRSYVPGPVAVLGVGGR